MSRIDYLRAATPQLVADVQMYETADGGRADPAFLGWGCPVMVSKIEPLQGWDAWPLLGDRPLRPGDARRLGFVFLSGEEAADVLKRVAAGRFAVPSCHEA